MTVRLVLTRGEQAILRKWFPSYRWKLEVSFTAEGIQRLSRKKAELESNFASKVGTSTIAAELAYDAELLGRIIARYDSRAQSDPPTEAGTPSKEPSVSGES